MAVKFLEIELLTQFHILLKGKKKGTTLYFYSHRQLSELIGSHSLQLLFDLCYFGQPCACFGVCGLYPSPRFTDIFIISFLHRTEYYDLNVL